MNVDKNLEKEVLTRLLHAHPSGLGKEVLDNYRGEKVVASTLATLQERCLLYTSPSPRDGLLSRMPSSA